LFSSLLNTSDIVSIQFSFDVPTIVVIMPVASNLLSSVLIAPIVVVLAAISLATLQRSMEWIAFIANNPQKYANLMLLCALVFVCSVTFVLLCAL
jgi:hypothetical protein